MGLLCAGAICSVACADRLIEIPTGKLIYPERLTVEAGFLTGTPERERVLVNFRVGGLLEIQGARTGFENRLEVYGLQYSVYPEIPSYAPGISIGVLDMFDRTAQGRGYYVALSYSIAALGQTPLDHDLRVHLGFGWEGMSGFFVGFDVPLTNQIFLRAEHTGSHINAALAWRPTNQVELRGSVIRERTCWSIMIRLWED
ncbi:MAG: hypothetical protein CFK49_01325 [Armatimonadetes bacterium JP3_11]|jgi:hypothetical protein|nr:MAG: hypothetical protein CFK48_04020 [Armatimonadetes bacterium CP1_7O]OYT75801.1 MAG: hypothetical protein CFK49_01325 [Armatimonadetes bacterium JP3_11]